MRATPRRPKDLATFLLVRGEFAWLGYGWEGCNSGGAPATATKYGEWRPDLDEDYGQPLDATCRETASGSAVFTRRWSKATVELDCARWAGKITMHDGRVLE